MKKCIYCNIEKADSEYYVRPQGTLLNSACKECMKKKSKERQGKHKSPESELWLIQELLKRKIPAMHGKEFRCYSWVDVVAYGMVTIDVKLSQKGDSRYYTWQFTPSQVKGQVQSPDIIALVEDNPIKRVVHFIESTSHIFTHDSGIKKGAIVFPMRWQNEKSRLTQATISNHTDNWDEQIVIDPVLKIPVVKRG